MMGKNARTSQGIAGVLPDHLIRDEGVGGSNPLTPTNLSNNLAKWPRRVRPAYGQIGLVTVLSAVEITP
jgi:hypothetical protein